MRVGGQRHAPAALPPAKAPGPVWTAAENLAPTGIRSPDRPARSESLYRLSYPGPWSYRAYFVYTWLWRLDIKVDLAQKGLSSHGQKNLVMGDA